MSPNLRNFESAVSDLLTEDEHAAMRLAADLRNAVARVVGHASTRASDLREITDHIHAIQAMVLSQAAARAYPHLYRLLGEELP